jgi:RNA polymerase sigma-70 factor (ECF subfamily)
MRILTDKTPGSATDPNQKLRGDDRDALVRLVDWYGDRLRRKVKLRLDPRLLAPLDGSDVVHKAFLDVAGDLDTYLAGPELPPPLGLRLHAGRRLTTLHRQHKGTRLQDAGREISINHGALPQARSAALVSMLRGRQTRPTRTALPAERILRVPEALYSLEPIDPEVFGLRHLEQLGRAEAAQVLGIAQKAGAKPYFRPLNRLKDVLATLPGGREGL